MELSDILRDAGTAMDAIGVAVVIVGAAIASATALIRWIHREPGLYRWYRQQLGRSILLGLELMVAGDIIRTADDPTLMGVIVLGGIVLIRTILSFTLEVEITGRWPWRSELPPDRAADHTPTEPV